MRSLILVCLGAFSCSAQSGPALVGAGFSNPFPLVVAPGQLLTLFVEPGAGYNSSALPTVSAVFWNGSSEESIPVLQAGPSSAACSAPSNGACANLIAITVEVPLDVPLAAPPGSNILAIPSSIAVSMGGVTTSYFGVQALPNHVHILTSCDQLAGTLPCTALITHADGTPVSAFLPAMAGEELIAYATGLGQTNPPITTGQPAVQSSPTVAAFNLDLNYRANALATQPGAVGAAVAAPPLFAGATKGFTGLYQINFIVPAPPAGVQPCVDFAVAPAAVTAGYPVQSNLTVSIGSNVSFDGAGICVQPASDSL
jgi:uncharacterized protein (TIGR03437 family)